MSVFSRPIARALGLSIALSSVVSAQAPKSCDVNEGRPTQVGKATLAVQVASSTQNPADAAKQLASAVKLLTENGDKMENQPGRNMVLGKTLVIWSMQPNVELVSKRGALGYTTSPEATIDLAAAIDTAFKVVETAFPECIAETARYRGQKPWVMLVNKAIERLNSDDTDGAEAAARRAIVLNPFGPYGYVVLANVMQKRQKGTEAFALYRRSVEIASRDTLYDDIRRQSLIYLGNLAADSAEALTDSVARRPYVETARTAFEQLMKDKGIGELGSNARAGLCRVAIATGDTASLRQTYKDPLTAPATFTYSDLMSAGVCLARADMVPEASALFQAAYDKNPYHRDALANLAIMRLRTDQHELALPLSIRLASIEPNNPDDLQLLVLSYAGIAKKARETRLTATRSATATKGTKGAATKTNTKAPAAPKMSVATQDSLFRIEKAYTDSAVTSNDRKDKLVYKVSLSEFSINDEKATVGGSITNLSQATSKDSVLIHVDFMDREGKVVVSKEAKVAPIEAGRSRRFSVLAQPGKGISTFRYAPINTP